MAMGERNILHIGIRSFLAGVEKNINLQLQRKPLIVGGGIHLRGIVLCASEEAVRCGVRIGMQVGQALSLCPDAVVVPPHFSLYEKATMEVVKVLRNYSPIIELSGHGELFVDLTGTTRLWGKSIDVAVRVLREIKNRIRLNTVSAGVGSNRLVAKIASMVAVPSGVMEIIHGSEASMIAPLPLNYLPSVGPKVRKKLMMMGIRSIGMLADVPQKYLEAVFGKAGILIHSRACGIDESPVVAGSKRIFIKRGGNLEVSSIDIDFLRSVLFRNIEEICSCLRSSRMYARSITVSAVYEDSMEASGCRRLLEDTDIEFEIFPVAAAILETFMRRRVAISALFVSVVCRTTTMGAWWQVPLFDTVAVKRRKLFSAIDAVRKKYGNHSLVWGGTKGI